VEQYGGRVSREARISQVLHFKQMLFIRTKAKVRYCARAEADRKELIGDNATCVTIRDFLY
jgi:hypothetical protein